MCDANSRADGCMQCVGCRLMWDRDDEPPPCPKETIKDERQETLPLPEKP